MDVKSKWNPGAEPAIPNKDGMTHKPGLSIRAEFAARFLSALLSTVNKLTPEMDETYVAASLHFADALIFKLYPEPIAKVHAAQKEMSSCQHEGELIFEHGKALCMKCRQVVPKEIVLARMK